MLLAAIGAQKRSDHAAKSAAERAIATRSTKMLLQRRSQEQPGPFHVHDYCMLLSSELCEPSSPLSAERKRLDHA